jgi:hypothetical protein
MDYPKSGHTQQIVSRRMWGVSTGGAGNWNFRAFTNARFRSQAGTINPGLWRFNGNLNGARYGHDGKQTWLSQYFNRDGLVNTATWANLIGNFPAVDPLGISAVIIGVNVDNHSGFSDVASYGSAMGNLARHLDNAIMPNGQKFPFIGFESQNESTVPLPIRMPYYNAMVKAVKSVNPNLLVCGPVGDFATAWMPAFQQQASQLDVYDYHVYIGAYPHILDPPYGTTRGTEDMNGIAGVLAQGPQAIFLSEYNIDWDCKEPHQRKYTGAVFNAVMLMQALDASPLPFWAGIWDAFGDGTCGIIDDPSYAVFPAGALISQGVRTIHGPRWNVPTNSAGLLACAVTPSPGAVGLMIVNNGKGAQRAKTVALSHWPVNSSGNGTARIWQMSPSAQRGSTSTLAVRGGLMAAIDFPDPSITIISI